MYETSCTCEILHRTPHVHCLNSGLDLPLKLHHGYFLPFWTRWFWALYLRMMDPADTYCALFKPEETVYRFSIFFYHMSNSLNIWKSPFIYTSQIHNLEGTPAWTEKGKKEISNNVLALLIYLRLVCCFLRRTAVECYLFIWIYFYEVCYWSELHIYFVNHECLCYKFVYFNNKCPT